MMCLSACGGHETQHLVCGEPARPHSPGRRAGPKAEAVSQLALGRWSERRANMGGGRRQSSGGDCLPHDRRETVSRPCS